MMRGDTIKVKVVEEEHKYGNVGNRSITLVPDKVWKEAKDLVTEKKEGKEEEPCDECQRRNSIKCLQEALDALPDQVTGFGAHDGYCDGMVNGVRHAIEGVMEELETLSKEAHDFGVQKDEDKG